MTHNMYWKRILSVIIIGLGLTFVQPATAQTRNRTKVHTVQAKETVYSLARQYGLTEEDIYTLNPSAKGGIKEGQTLLIPAKSVSAATPHAAPPGGEHVIQPQETLFSVSRKYGLSELALLKANPGITAANFPAGYRLHIPRGESAPVATAPSVQTGKAIEVGLMLPLSGNIQRYVEFYEGMLMGLFRLKKKGVSVTLRVYDVSNTSDAEDVVHSGELNDCHLIIGGTSNDQISVIGRYADRRGINYVVPFSSEKIAGKAYPNLFQINPPQEYIYPYVARAFMHRYADRSVVFVTGRDEPDACASHIMAEMDKAGRSYTKVAADTGQGELVKMLRSDSRIVIMPCLTSESFLNRLLTLADSNGKPERITFFGYPEWQSFGKDKLARMRKYGSSFYSSFFFDPAQPENERFLTQYYAWYNHKVSGGFPKYSVLGYDITNYFIGALASYGRSLKNNLTMLPSTGLQTDFRFRELTADNGCINLNIFFVTLRTDGSTERTSVTR